MRPWGGGNNHHAKQTVSEQMVPDLCLVPLRQLTCSAVVRFRLPVQKPGVIQIFPQDFPLQTIEHAILCDQILLKIFLSEVVDGTVDLSIEFLQIAVSISLSQSRNSACARVP